MSDQGVLTASPGLASSLSRMSVVEREGFKAILTSACRSALFLDGSGVAIRDEQALRQALRLAGGLRHPTMRNSQTGVLWHGRIPGLSEEKIEHLRAEAQSLRPKAKDLGGQWSVKAGPEASRFSSELETQSLVGSSSPRLRVTGFENYAYYEAIGAKIDPHFDNFEFPFNAVLTIACRSTSAPASSLVVFDAEGVPKRYPSDVGVVTIFHGASFLHFREALLEGEGLIILGIGLTVCE